MPRAVRAFKTPIGAPTQRRALLWSLVLAVSGLSGACHCGGASLEENSLEDKGAEPDRAETTDCAGLQRDLRHSLEGGLQSRWRLSELLEPMLAACPIEKRGPSHAGAGATAKLPVATARRTAEVCEAVLSAQSTEAPGAEGNVTPSAAPPSNVQSWLERAPELVSACTRPSSRQARQLVWLATRAVDPRPEPRLRLHHAWQGEVLPGGLGQPDTLAITLDLTCRPCPDALDRLEAQGLRPLTKPAASSVTATRCATPEGWPVDCDDPYWSPADGERRVLSRHVLEIPDAGPPSQVAARFTGELALASTPPAVRFQAGFFPALPDEQVSPLFVQRLPHSPDLSPAKDRYLAGVALVAVRRSLRLSVGSRRGASVIVRNRIELDEAFRRLPPVEERPFFVPFRLLLMVLETDAHDVPYSFSLRTVAPPGDVWLPPPGATLPLHPTLVQALQNDGAPVGD